MSWQLIGGIALGLAAFYAACIGLLWVFRPKDASLGELVRIVPDVLRLIRGLLGDRTVPVGPRIAVGGLLLWLVSPIDLIPEFIPVLGPLDDIVVAVLVLRYVRRRLGDQEFRRRWPGSDQGYAALARVL